MGPQEDYIETVVTCEGDFHDPQLPRRLECFRQQLKDLLLADTHKPLILKKVEPWNSVRVTFNIPREAALRLKQLAEQGSASLRRLGVLAVQIDGDRLVSLTLATPNNQHAELIIRTHDASAQATTAGPSQASSGMGSVAFDGGLPSSSDELGSPGPSNMEVTRKNIEEYLRQGSQLFGSILATSASGAAGSPDLSAPSNDVFKTPSHDSGSFRPNSVGSDVLAGPSGLTNIQQRSQISSSGSLGLGVGAGIYPSAFSAGAPGSGGGRGSRLAGPAPHGHGMALPQTAAVGFSVLGLPPPPPYPHSHGGVMVNNVGRQGKKGTASSPLLVNLLQTEPLAGAGGGINSKMLDPDAPKPKKRRRKRKDKQATATSAGDEGQSSLGSSYLPSSPGGPFSSVLKDTGSPSAGMNSLISRHTSPPLPLQSPRLSLGLVNAAVSGIDLLGDERRVRSPPSASAALAAMAESQRHSDVDPSDIIINPYTGQLEPRDTATDLSPSKKDVHKPRISPAVVESLAIAGSYSSVPNIVPAVAAALDSELERAAAGDPLSLNLDSVLPSASSMLTSARNEGQIVQAVLNSGREAHERNFPSSTMSSASYRGHGLAGDNLIGRLQDLAHNLVSSSPPVGSTSTLVYAQNPSSATQSAPRPPALMLSDSTANGPRQTPLTVVSPSPSALIRGQLTVNGPVTSCASPKTVSASTSTVSQGVRSPQGQGTVPAAYTGNPHPLPSHVQSSARPTPRRPNPVHNVQGSGGSEEASGGDAPVHEQHTAVTHSESVSHRPVLMTDRTQVQSPRDVTRNTSVPSPPTTTVPSDPFNLLNSTARLSPAVGPVAQTLAADPSSVNTASPVGGKAMSEGDDNSNHSGIGPDGIADGGTTTVTLLDGSGTKTDNHDSGLGSASERSDDTPSEPGDSEYHNNAVTSDPASTDGGSVGKSTSSVGNKGPVNCKTETTSCIEPSTITVGYVQVSEHSARMSTKEMKEQPLLKHMAHLSAQQDTRSVATGNKLLSDDAVHGMAHLMVKSSATLTSVASQVALLAGKETVAKLPLTAVTTLAAAVQQMQQAVQAKSKGIANCQVTAVHQNGPVRPRSPNQLAFHKGPHGPAKSVGLSHPSQHEPQTAQHSPAPHHHSAVNSHNDGITHTNSVGGPHSGVSAASSISRSVASSVTQAGKHSHGDTQAHNSMPVSSAAESPSKVGLISEGSTATSLTLSASEGSKLSSPVKQHLARLTTVSGSDKGKLTGLDSSSTPPELIAASDTGELDMLEAPQHLYQGHANTGGDDPHSPVFETEDLVLGERSLTGFLEADVRHSATNGGGGGGVSTDSRVGSNITSIYSKRSSPVNVNMLNHIYAPGLPLPRRLTESVQRLVKPLPTSESSLPQPRPCKSPGASSSRHSSNGSSSPGRASQGGARSPGVSTAASRMLAYDKVVMSQAGFLMNSSSAASMGGPLAYLPTPHSLQDSCSNASVNCCTATPHSSTPHLLSALPPAPHMALTPCTSSTFPVSSHHHHSAANAYSQPAASYAHTGSQPASLVPLPAAQTTAMAAQSSALSTTTATSAHLTSAHHSLVTGSPSVMSSVSTSLSHDVLMSRHHQGSRVHSMQGVHLQATSKATSSAAPGFHVAVTSVSQQLPHSCVGNASSLSSSLPLSAGHESGTGHSLPTVLRLPSHGTPRLSAPGHPVTMCNNVSVRTITDSALHPHRPVSSIPAPFSTQSVPVTCMALSYHSSPPCVSGHSASVPAVAGTCGSSDLTTQGCTESIQVSAHTVPTTPTTTALSSSTSSAGKTHAEQGLVTTVAATSNPPHSSQLRHWSAACDPGSAAAVGSVSVSVGSVPASNSGLVTVVSVGVDIAEQAATKTVVSLVGSSAGEVQDTRAEGQISEKDTELGRTQSHKQSSPPHSAASVSHTADSDRLGTQTLPAVFIGSVQQPADNCVRTGNSVVSSADPESTSVLKHSSMSVRSEEAGSVADHAESGIADSDAGSAPTIVPERETSSGDVQIVHPPSVEKPPQLQPPPPPLIPTVVPSATPPPPPLTPVPQERDHSHQAASSSQVDLTPTDSACSDKTETAAGTVSTKPMEASFLAAAPSQTSASTEPAADADTVGSIHGVQDTRTGTEDNAGEEEEGGGKPRTPSEDFVSSNGATSAQQTFKSTPHGMPELSSEENARTRRITRKRKSTQSESDSSEPPQKMNSTDGVDGAGGSRERSSERESIKASSDQPPKLQREGKRASGAEDKEREKGASKDATHHHERNIIEATPEEIAKKLAAASASGRRRTYYAYVPEKSLSQSYFDTPVLHGRTRSQSSTTKDGTVPAPATAPPTMSVTAANAGQPPSSSGQGVPQPALDQKDEGGDAASSSKRSTRLRTKDTSDSSSSKRKRGTGKEYR